MNTNWSIFRAMLLVLISEVHVCFGMSHIPETVEQDIEIGLLRMQTDRVLKISSADGESIDRDGIPLPGGVCTRQATLSHLMQPPRLQYVNLPRRACQTRQVADCRSHYGYERWERLVPTHVKVQFAGSIGAVSVGCGWDYGRRGQWETDLMFGVVPPYCSDGPKITSTLRECYVPWSVTLGGRWSLEPLSCGLYLSTIFNEKFWVKEPARYPKGYYTFPTRVRSYLFLGQRVSCRLNVNRRERILQGISVYYELSTCDFYIISMVKNRSLHLGDILSLSFGVKFHIYGPRALCLGP